MKKEIFLQLECLGSDLHVDGISGNGFGQGIPALGASTANMEANPLSTC